VAGLERDHQGGLHPLYHALHCCGDFDPVFTESGTVQRVLFLVKLMPGHSDVVMQDFLKIKELDMLDFVTETTTS